MQIPHSKYKIDWVSVHLDLLHTEPKIKKENSRVRYSILNSRLSTLDRESGNRVSQKVGQVRARQTLVRHAYVYGHFNWRLWCPCQQVNLFSTESFSTLKPATSSQLPSPTFQWPVPSSQFPAVNLDTRLLSAAGCLSTYEYIPCSRLEYNGYWQY